MIRKIISLTLLLLFAVGNNAQTVNDDQPLRSTISDPQAKVPDDLEQNYDNLLAQWGSRVKYASNCNSRYDEDVLTSDSIYINRLYSLPTQMELVFNPLVRSYIEMYSGRRRNQVSYMLGLGKYYFPIFEAELDKEGLPLELKYLPVIESALNPTARSRVGATGLWQFMAPTGRMYDLEINSLVDERRDPVKATRAAVKYLKDMYEIYKDWNLVIAAYNCGPGNVNKAIRRSGGLTDYWEIYPYLPRETRGYVPIFIAATYIMNYHDKHNICPTECELPASMDSIKVSESIHFQQIADVLNVSMDDLRNYNPQFTRDIIPGNYKPYAINLPINKVTAFIDKKEDIISYRSSELLTHRKVAGADVVNGGTPSGTGKSHKVKRGESLTTIAKRYGITVTQLKNWNGLKSNKVASGRYLIVALAPSKQKEEQSTESQAIAQEQSSTTASTNKVNVETETTYYKVRKGDTWSGIAKKTGASINDIKKWNGIKKNTLIAGVNLKIIKTVYVAVETPDSIQLVQPELAVLQLDSTYTSGLIDGYLKKVETERNEESLPTITIMNADEDDNPLGRHFDDTRLIYHKVKKGETVAKIAEQYNISRNDIMKWNNLSSSVVSLGQRLMIRLPDKEVGG